jgi:hypothetical protein
MLVCVLLVLMAAVTVVGILVPAGLGWDFANFYDTGRRAAAGQFQDIYHPTSLIAGSTPQGKMTFWGTPISAWLYAPLSVLSPAAALIVFKLLGSMAFAAGLVVLYRTTRSCAGAVAGVSPTPGAAWFGPLFCLLVLLYQPFWTIFRVGGQTTPFVFLLLTLGLVSYLRSRFLLTAIALVLAVIIKPAFLYVPLVLALVSGRRFLLALGTAALVAGAASLALLGIPIHREFLEVLRRGASASAPWTFNSSLYIVVDAFRPIVNSIPVPGGGGGLPGILAGVLRAAVILLFASLFVSSRREPWAQESRALFQYLLAVSFCLLISTVVWEHDLAILFIPLAFLVAACLRLDRGARAHLGVIFGLAMFQNLVLVLLFRDRVGVHSTLALLAVSIVKAGPLIALLGFLLFRRATVFRLLRPAG